MPTVPPIIRVGLHPIDQMAYFEHVLRESEKEVVNLESNQKAHSVIPMDSANYFVVAV